jgi:predicted small metal-binding protein
MKTMTCFQLGGACNQEFSAETFEEMAELSKQHGIEKFQQGDKAHLKAKEEMQKLMSNQDAMSKWFQDKKQEFDTLPES